MKNPNIKRLFSENGIFSGKRVLAVTVVLTMLMGTTLTAYAASGSTFPIGSSTYTTQSDGRIEYKEDENNPSIIIDSEDIKQLATGLNECHEEVNNIYSALNDVLGAGTFPGDDNNSIEEIINSKEKEITVRPDGTLDGSTPVSTLLPAIVPIVEVDSSVPKGTTYIKDDSSVANAYSTSANNLSKGASAWIDGRLVVGNGKDNDTYYESGYNKGYSDGYSKATSGANIVYTYHVHTGGAATGGGCYTVPVYKQHKHTDACYKYTKHDHTNDCISASVPYTKTCGCSANYGVDLRCCDVCGHGHGRGQKCNKDMGTGYRNEYGKCTGVLNSGRILICGKTEGQRYSSEGIEYYNLGCGKTPSTIEKATIIYP